MVRKSYLVYSLDMHCLSAESGKETAWSRTWRSWKIWTRRKSPRLNATEVIMSKKRQKFHFFDRRWNSQVVWNRSGFPKIHLNSGSPCTREHNDVPQGESDGCQPLDEVTDDNEVRNDLMFDRRELHLSSSLWSILKEESFLKPLLNVDVVRRTNTSLDILLESRIGCVLERWQWPGSIGTIDPFHAVHWIK